MNNWLTDTGSELRARDEKREGDKFDRRISLSTWLKEDPKSHIREYANQFLSVLPEVTEKYEIPLEINSNESRGSIKFELKHEQQVILFGRILVDKSLTDTNEFWTIVQFPLFIAPNGLTSTNAGGYGVSFRGSNTDVLDILIKSLETESVGFHKRQGNLNERQLMLFGDRGNKLSHVENLLWEGDGVLEEYSKLMLETAIEQYGGEMKMQTYAQNSILRISDSKLLNINFSLIPFQDKYAYTPLTNYTVQPLKGDGSNLGNSIGRISHKTPYELIDLIVKLPK